MKHSNLPHSPQDKREGERKRKRLHPEEIPFKAYFSYHVNPVRLNPQKPDDPDFKTKNPVRLSFPIVPERASSPIAETKTLIDLQHHPIKSKQIIPLFPGSNQGLYKIRIFAPKSRYQSN
jgi:hypothetical protein